MKSILICFLFAATLLQGVNATTYDPEWDDPNRSTRWAVLITGSDDLMDGGYRHQADVAHAYHLFRNAGVPAHHMSLISPNNCYENGSFGKLLFNWPSCNATNLIHGLEFNCTDTRFLAEMAFMQLGFFHEAAEKIPRPKPEDTLFLYVVGHGQYGVWKMGDEYLYKDAVHFLLGNLAMYFPGVKVLFLVDTCMAGSMFEDDLFSRGKITYLGRELFHDITVFTASSPEEESFGYFCDTWGQTPLDEFQNYNCLADEFSYQWMWFFENYNLTEATIGDLYNFLKRQTLGSTVTRYGVRTSNFDVKISSFIGPEKPKVVRIREERMLYCICDSPEPDDVLIIYGYCEKIQYKNGTTWFPEWSQTNEINTMATNTYYSENNTLYTTPEPAEAQVTNSIRSPEWVKAKLDELGESRLDEEELFVRRSIVKFYRENRDEFDLRKVDKSKRKLKRLELFARAVNGTVGEKWKKLYQEELEHENKIDTYLFTLNKTMNVFAPVKNHTDWDCYKKAIERFDKRFGKSSYGFRQFSYLANLCEQDPENYKKF